MMRTCGSAYRRDLGSVLWRQHGSIVSRCRTEMGPAPAFGLFFTVGGRGEISDVVASPPSVLGQCLAAGLNGATLPVTPPFAPFHALMTMQLGA
jgi:hypothetical protein